MPSRDLVTEELAELLSVLAHGQRVRIIEELRTGERDVNFLAEILRIPHSRVSQHLSVLRARHVVATRRDGRHVFYRLSDPRLAAWLVEGLQFIESELNRNERLRNAVGEVRSIWSEEPSE